jgi:preprotein translocase subunit SecA
MFKFLAKFFDANERELNRLREIVEEINQLEDEMRALKDDEFPAKTAEFKLRLEKGETLDDLLPEAFALAREAIRRTVGERAYDVQLIAAIALHQGRIAEQKTGEGKTLSAAIASYLNALAEKGVHVVTVNDYLARRDTGWYGVAHNFMGVSVGCIMHDQAFVLDLDYKKEDVRDPRLSHLKPVSRKEAYQADVTYGTNNEFGFDYLRDNMVHKMEERVQRGHNFAIVDEVDSILIDEARTPLIISAPDTEPTDKYYRFAKLIQDLRPETDYTIDEKVKTANLTEHGIMKVEKKLGIKNLYEKDFSTIHHIENALKARTLYKKDRDYVVKDKEVVIVDEFTGRLMHGRRWSEGLHQAVEAKENVPIKQESKTLATISFQNYFRMYNKLSGMTGTAATEAEEFREIYGLQVVVVPTNEPVIRKDHGDEVYKTKRAKYAAVVKEISEMHEQGRPVLVGTTSIEKNEIVDEFLKRKGIPHNVLNAKHHTKEAMIIADAGKVGAVTVATNMAGRGVDIVLGGDKPDDKDDKEAMKKWQQEHDKVVKLGGLHVIGTERHEARRIDNQFRGRSGRQGDPGSSRFYVSLEDDIMRLFGGEQVQNLMNVFKMPENMPLKHPMVSKAIQQAQIKVESFHFDARKRLVEYDDVLNKQREIIYRRREKVLRMEETEKRLKEQILANIADDIKNFVHLYSPDGIEGVEYDKIINDFVGIVPFDHQSQNKLKEQLKDKSAEEMIKMLSKLAEKTYSAREEKIGADKMQEVEKFVALSVIDKNWVDHLDAIDDLREGIGLRGYGQLDPLVEYKKEAFEMFQQLMANIDYEISRRIFRVQVGFEPETLTDEMKIERPEINLTQPQQQKGSRNRGRGDDNQEPVKSERVNPETGKKIGRNDPCWCGSGKKWKKCCYPETPR